MQLDEHGEPVVSPEEAERRARAEARRELDAIDEAHLPNVAQRMNAAMVAVLMFCLMEIALMSAAIGRAIDVTQEGPRLLIHTGMIVAGIGIAIALIGCWSYTRERRALLAERAACERRLR